MPINNSTSKTPSRARRLILKSMAAGAIASVYPKPVRALNKSDVVVIGAGLSGLYAATILQDEGYNVTVLEADKRVGGRVLSERSVPGNPESGGTSFGPGYARLINTARRFNVELIDITPIVPYFMHQELAIDQTIVPIKDWPNHPKNVLPQGAKEIFPNRFFQQVVSENNPLMATDAWMDPENFHLDQSVHQWMREQGFTDSLINLVYNTNITHGNTAKDVSMLMLFFVNAFMNSQIALSFNTFGYTAEGGNMSIPEAMASNLSNEVQLHKKVIAITTTQNNGEIVCKDGSLYRAEHVICSVPFSVLKKITISPSITGPQAEAINTLRSQKLNLLHMVPRSPFWQKDGLSPNMFTDTKAGMVVAERKGSSPSEVTSLTAWLRGPLADELDKMTETDAIGSVIESIETLRPSAKDQLEPVAYHSWFQNPYSEGDWAIWGPGQIRKFGRNVATPHGQIHFCGEHTAVSNRGMEGAMESGERVALEVLGIV